MRLRLTELLQRNKEAGREPTSLYGVLSRTGDRIGRSTLYRIAQSDGRWPTFDDDMLEALCDVFGVGPADLLERTAKPSARRRKP
jgi:hypothetical protein